MSVNTERLTLAGNTPVATGKTRLVFEHPHDSTCLIKVHKRSAPDSDSAGLQGWFRRVEDHFVYISGFVRELKVYVLSRYGDRGAVVRHISPILGLVDTDLGLGLVVKAERTADGSLAPTLRSLLKTGKFTPAHESDLQAALSAIGESDLVLGDLNLDNLVYSVQSDGHGRFVLVDGLGERTFIPIQEWSRWARRRQKTLFINKVGRRLESYKKQKWTVSQ